MGCLSSHCRIHRVRDGCAEYDKLVAESHATSISDTITVIRIPDGTLGVTYYPVDENSFLDTLYVTTLSGGGYSKIPAIIVEPIGVVPYSWTLEKGVLPCVRKSEYDAWEIVMWGEIVIVAIEDY
jgi:hypothetical protein